MNAPSTRSKDVVAVIAIAALALGARLAVLPFATTDGSNSAARVWMAWRWLDDPGVITHGVWGPLHFYLIGAVLALTDDPILAPVLLHVLFGVGAAILFYIFVRLEFAGPNSALLAGLAFALYPVLLRASVAVRAESPFVFFVLACMILLSLTRTRAPAIAWAAAAGMMLTMASALRFEGWLLTPFLALLLWPRFVPMLVFLVAACLHPVFWMIGNMAASGDPLAGISFAQSWELESMGRAQLSLAERLREVMSFVSGLVRGLTPPMSLLVLIGGLVALLWQRRSALWLMPPIALFSLLLWSVSNGTLVPKSSYTAMTGTMILPFAALAFQAAGAERWRAALLGIAAVATVGAVAFTSCERCVSAAGLQALRGSSPVPWFENQDVASELGQIVAANLAAPPAGVVTDFYGHDGTNWVLLLARTHPDSIFFAPWAPFQPLDESDLAAFAQAHPLGLLIMRPGSRFAHQIALDPPQGVANLAGHAVRIEQVASVAWPENDWHALGPDDVGEERIVVYRYAQEGASEPPSPTTDP